MSKKVQAIIAGAIVLVLLGGAVAALVLAPKSKDSAEATSSLVSSELITLFEGVAGELEYVTVENEKDNYKIELLGENKWGIKALDGFAQVDTKFADTVGSFTTLYANEIVEENCTDLAKFGLDKPSLIAELKYKGKDGFQITLGELSPDGYTRYAIKTGETTVYGLSSNTLSALYLSRYDYLELSLLPALETGEDGNPVAPKLDAIKVVRPDMEKPIELQKYKAGELTENAITTTGLKMVSPIDAMADDQYIQDNIYSLFGLAASSVEMISPTAADLTKYGFDAATSTFDLTYNETSSIKITTGSGVECSHEEGEDLTSHKHVITHYYAMKDGVDVIYLIPKEAVTWMELQPKSIMSSIVVLPPVLDLDSVVFQSGKDTYAIEYIKSPEDAADTKEMTAKLNGKDTDIDGAKKLLQLFYATSVQDVNTVVPTKPADASVTYHYTGGKVDVVEFFVQEDRQIIISLNGNNGYTGRSGYVEKMIKEVNNLISGKEIGTDW